MTAKDHYDNHLGNFYSWMYGDFSEKQFEQEQFFRQNGIVPHTSKHAIDLGAGHGLQTASLINIGFKVTAVDFNEQLLHELKINTGNKAIDDLIAFAKHHIEGGRYHQLHGDTITHFESISHVNTLFSESRRILTENGHLILSFRDLTNELTGENRFIPVRSDNSRIATCFLEYFSDHVMVYDILHERIDDRWQQKVSCYPNLRLNLQIVSDLLMKNNFKIRCTETIDRMIYIVAQKPSNV